MKIYLITRKKGEGTYCEFHGAVIAARNTQQAREIMIGLDDQNSGFNWDCVVVSLTAKRGMKAGVVLSDYYDG